MALDEFLTDSSEKMDKLILFYTRIQSDPDYTIITNILADFLYTRELDQLQEERILFEGNDELREQTLELILLRIITLERVLAAENERTKKHDKNLKEKVESLIFETRKLTTEASLLEQELRLRIQEKGMARFLEGPADALPEAKHRGFRFIELLMHIPHIIHDQKELGRFVEVYSRLLKPGVDEVVPCDELKEVITKAQFPKSFAQIHKTCEMIEGGAYYKLIEKFKRMVRDAGGSEVKKSRKGVDHTLRRPIGR